MAATTVTAHRASLSPRSALRRASTSRPMATGLLLALVASACFSTAGTFATSLIDAGWSPAAAVTARIVGAALLLTIPAVRALRGRWRPLLAAWRTVAGYGLLAVAGSQLAYFMAVSQLSVGVALLMEYTSPVLIVGWLWLRHGHRPRPLTLAGTGLAVAGLALVLDVLHGVSIGAVGLGWGLIAALCSAAYFLLSAKPLEGVPALTLVGAGMWVAAVVLGAACALGFFPFVWSSAPVHLVGATVPPLVPIAALVVLTAVLSYTIGLLATRLLGSKVSSFVSLSEVIFAILFAWVALGQLPAPTQLLGGLLILLGATAVKADEGRVADIAVDPAADLSSTDEPPVDPSADLSHSADLPSSDAAAAPACRA